MAEPQELSQSQIALVLIASGVFSIVGGSVFVAIALSQTPRDTFMAFAAGSGVVSGVVIALIGWKHHRKQRPDPRNPYRHDPDSP